MELPSTTSVIVALVFLGLGFCFARYRRSQRYASVAAKLLGERGHFTRLSSSRATTQQRGFFNRHRPRASRDATSEGLTELRSHDYLSVDRFLYSPNQMYRLLHTPQGTLVIAKSPQAGMISGAWKAVWSNGATSKNANFTWLHEVGALIGLDNDPNRSDGELGGPESGLAVYWSSRPLKLADIRMMKELRDVTLTLSDAGVLELKASNLVIWEARASE